MSLSSFFMAGLLLGAMIGALVGSMAASHLLTKQKAPARCLHCSCHPELHQGHGGRLGCCRHQFCPGLELVG